MELSDLTKEVRRFLLEHWSEKEIEDRLRTPEYFFDHVVQPRLTHLKSLGRPAPRIRLKKDQQGNLRVVFNSY